MKWWCWRVSLFGKFRFDAVVERSCGGQYIVLTEVIPDKKREFKYGKQVAGIR